MDIVHSSSEDKSSLHYGKEYQKSNLEASVRPSVDRVLILSFKVGMVSSTLCSVKL